MDRATRSATEKPRPVERSHGDIPIAGRMRRSGQAALSVDGDGWRELPDDVYLDELADDEVGGKWT
jgi:hypothetical protein